jgi:tetratricopeptide (TPR) repeat protein
MQISSNLEMAKTELKLGNAWQLRGNLKEAIQHYQEALRLNPNDLAA